MQYVSQRFLSWKCSFLLGLELFKQVNPSDPKEYETAPDWECTEPEPTKETNQSVSLEGEALSLLQKPGATVSDSERFKIPKFNPATEILVVPGDFDPETLNPKAREAFELLKSRNRMIFVPNLYRFSVVRFR